MAVDNGAAGGARPRVYLTRALPEEARQVVAAACDLAEWNSESSPVPRDELLRAVHDADGVLTLLTDRVDEQFLDAAPKCRVVANMAVGYDNVDLEALTRRGVLLTNTPDVLTETRRTWSGPSCSPRRGASSKGRTRYARMLGVRGRPCS